MIGSFDNPPFPVFRISPKGIATRKYWISPCNMQLLTTPLPSSVWQATELGFLKQNIISAFKVLPIHPDFWPFFGVCWKRAYNFSVRLMFGCRSSPKIFDSLSEALCSILTNNYRLPYILHLLDNFHIVTPPSSPWAYYSQKSFLRLILTSVKYQFILRAAHNSGHHNRIADSLSDFSFQKFRHLAPESHPTAVPPFSATILLKKIAPQPGNLSNTILNILAPSTLSA